MTQSQHQVERRLLMDVVVRQGPAVLELLAREDQPLLVGRDALLVLDLGIGVRVARVFRSAWQTSGAATDYVPPARLGTADSTPTCGRGPVQPTTPWDYQEEMADRRRNGTGVAGMRR